MANLIQKIKERLEPVVNTTRPNNQNSTIPVRGKEELPSGVWRGGEEELPIGTWRGGEEELPIGTWRGGEEELPVGTWRAEHEQVISPARFEALPQGTFLAYTTKWSGMKLSKVELNPYIQNNFICFSNGDVLPHGTLLSPYNIKDKYEFPYGVSYEFRFVYNDGGYFEIDILDQPDYLGRPDDLHTTHRLSSDRSDCRHKICWDPERSLDTKEKAYAVAEKWAQLTERYIRTGSYFQKSD